MGLNYFYHNDNIIRMLEH